MACAKESKQSESWPVACRWLAVGTVVFYAAIGSSVVHLAAAQELPSKQNNAAVASSVLRFNIPPGTLGSALPEFELASELHVMAPDPKMLSLPGVSGSRKPKSAMENGNYVRDVQITEPQLGTTPASGTTLVPCPTSTPLRVMTVNRNELAANSTETYFTDQLDLTANFNTGVSHPTLVTGIEAGRETSDPVRPEFTNVVIANAQVRDRNL